MKFVCFVLALLLLVAPVTDLYGSVQITKSDLAANTSGAPLVRFSGTSFGSHGLSTSARDQHSKNTLNWSQGSGQTVFEFVLDHQKDQGSGSASLAGDLEFVSDTNEPFALSGFYNVSNFTSVPTNVIYEVRLRRLGTGGGFPLINQQHSSATLGEQFVLGGRGGDLYNSLSGGLTGNLVAGATYRLSLNIYINTTTSSTFAGPNSRALGNVTMTIGTRTETSTPEPVSFVVWGGIALMGGIFACRRRAA